MTNALTLIDEAIALLKVDVTPQIAERSLKKLMEARDLIGHADTIITDTLRKELQNIASAKWDGMTAEDFLPWAKSRARHALSIFSDGIRDQPLPALREPIE